MVLPPPPPPIARPQLPSWAGSPERLAWARRHGVSDAALAELAQLEGVYPIDPESADAGGTEHENELQAKVVILAPHKGYWLTRNNVGALFDAEGQMVRYGLCNRTAAENKMIKSSDLIGFRRLLITPDMVGSQVAQFASREIKKPGWVYRGGKREAAQKKFNDFVNANGGDARFACDLSTFDRITTL